MNVICQRSTSKLIKGAIYEVDILHNNTITRDKKIVIKGLGRYVVKNFTQLDGSPLPEIDWIDSSYDINANLYIKKPEELKKGDILACRYGSKYLHVGRKYRVSDIMIDGVNRYKTVKIKVDGFNRWLQPYRFRELSKNETRDISLNEIFESPETLSVDLSVRKIDTKDSIEREKVILSIIFNAILDIHRNNLSIIDWAVQKTGKRWDIDKNDLTPYLDLTLSEIIKNME